MEEPIPYAVLEYAARVIEALNNVEDGDDGRLYVKDVQLYWYGDPTEWVITPDGHGGLGLGLAKNSAKSGNCGDCGEEPGYHQATCPVCKTE